MSSNREPIFQGDPAWKVRNGMIMNPARNFSIAGLERDARGVGCSLSLLDGPMPVRATEPAFGHLPSWAQPAWIRRLPL